MATSCRLVRFSNPSTLKAIEGSLLLRFLEPHRAFLAERGFAAHDGEPIDYDLLAEVLGSANDAMPEPLLDAMFFVDEMAVDEFFDDLMTEALAEGLNIGEDLTAADLAMRVWMAAPNIIERLHAERYLVRPRSFQSFLSTTPMLPELYFPSDATIQNLENDLNDWFETKKRGRGTRVFPFSRDNGVWFLVRHGEPYKREGTIKDGESSSVFYRPERFDVVTYDPAIGELSINARTKGEKQAYCRFFGKHVFGDESLFDADRLEGKFTLRPIIDDGPACVACSDIDGIESIHLCELQFRHHSSQQHVETHKADDVFAALGSIQHAVPPNALLLRAGFKVKFASAARPRSVVIRQPNVTVFDRESDAELLNAWLARRGFIQLEHKRDDVDIDAGAALAVH